ncbi:MAG: arsenite methyltransferase [Gammaproteobacteria bacterium]|nr:arsenite methyltransferase [Gammaproteobacteria bacterium]
MSVKEDQIRQQIRESYSKVAEASNDGGCCGVESSCCGVSADDDINTIVSTRMGYSEEDVNSTPVGADMGLGCGTPKAIASIQPHETVLDLGSGGGFDCFLAAQELAGTGKVIGVDMTPVMLSKARLNAEKSGFANVEFRLGEIEYLPVADESVDVIISNCVINLSPNKAQVFNDAFRVLKAGGRLAISDVVASAPLPDEIKNDKVLLSGCMAGASEIEELKKMMADSGFINIVITPKDESRSFIKDWAPGTNIEDFVISAYIQASKPSADCCCD